MMLSEFEKLTGLEVTTAEYEKIEAEYIHSSHPYGTVKKT